MTQPQTITPERQMAAAQVAGVFNSIHQYLGSLQLANEAGEALMTEQLRNAHARIEEASFWAVKHVLNWGVPPKPKAEETASAAGEAAPAAVPAETATGTDATASAAPASDATEPAAPSATADTLPTADAGTPTESV